MRIFLSAIAVLMWFSWARARAEGVPWFSVGGQPDMRRDRARAKTALRTRTLKPKSPLLTTSAPTSFPNLDALTRNPDTSHRLVADIKVRNPDRTLEWCAEKAIYDIERDRLGRH